MTLIDPTSLEQRGYMPSNNSHTQPQEWRTKNKNFRRGISDNKNEYLLFFVARKWNNLIL